MQLSPQSIERLGLITPFFSFAQFAIGVFKGGLRDFKLFVHTQALVE